jgi:hypothetical protein
MTNLPLLQALARTAVPAIGDFCLIFLLDGRALRCAAGAHVSAGGDALLRSFARAYRITIDDPVSTVARAVRTGRPQLRNRIAREDPVPAAVCHVHALHHRLACCSAVVVPIGAASRVRGAVSLCYSTSRRQHAPHDIPAARRIAAVVEQALRQRDAAAPFPIVHRPARLRARV